MVRNPSLFGTLTTAFVFALAAGAGADAPSPRRSLDQSLGGSVNRLGLQHTLGVRLSRPLSESAQPLLADAHVSAGLSHALTPSYTRLTLWAELAPLSILELRAGVEPGVYFGSFGSLQSFDGAGSDWSDDARHGRAGRAGVGARAFAASTLKLRLGELAVASTTTAEWWRSNAPGPYFYEPSRDTLLRAAGDRLLTVSSVLVRQQARASGGRLTYGLSHELLLVADQPGSRSQKAGVVVARRLAQGRSGRPGPTIGARVAYYLEDPHRKGQLTASLGVSVER